MDTEKKPSQRACIGILAHVDAGKTTLSERLLVEGGSLRAPTGAFLDTDAQEQARGITIFTSQAQYTHGGRVYQLADTPGHVDFSAEMTAYRGTPKRFGDGWKRCASRLSYS